MINFRIVTKTIGLILLVAAIFMLLPIIAALIWDGDNIIGFTKAALITAIFGGNMLAIPAKDKSIRKREGYLIVGVGWILLCLFGSLPYILGNDSTGIINAIFESTSGFTTTGASIYSNIEGLSTDTLFWRSLTQWIGGMGIIVFTVAIFPLLGIGGVELFVAESPGPDSNKIHPRIKEVAKRLWLIYISLTFALILILHFVSGMNVFDAINHGLTTMSTGGFSTKNSSMAAFGPAVHYPIMLFMFIAGMNYTIIYFLFKGKWKRAWRSDEFKFYLLLLGIIIALVTVGIQTSTSNGIEQSFRDGAFQVLSVITTTGYVSADYTSWNNGLTMLFFILLFMGACAGSTSGGIKIIRHLVFFKNSFLEFKRLLHPRAYIRLKIDQGLVSGTIITHILVFLLIYMIIFVLGSVLLMAMLKDAPDVFETAIGAMATSLGNVGPAIGSVGPVDNFAHLPQTAKLMLSFVMVIGRLEVFTILIILTPFFWRLN